MKEDNENGLVYVLINDAFPHLVKIGKTSRKDIRQRIKELSNTSVPYPFQCVYACQTDKYNELERALHIAFKDVRVNVNREFFEIESSQLIPLLKLFGTNIAEEINNEISKDATNEIGNKTNSHRAKRRKNFNFIEMGIPLGSELVFINDSDITCKVVENNMVEYKNELFSLTKLTTQLMNKNFNIQPTPYWFYEDKLLIDIYNDYQPLEEEC